MVCAKCKMAFPHIFAIVLRIDLTLRNMAQIVLSELTFGDTLIVDFCATEIVMRHSISHNSIFLSQNLRVMRFLQSLPIGFLHEKPIVLVCGSSIVHRRLESHFEIGDSHGLRISYSGLVFQFEFLGSEGLTSRRLIGKLGRSVRLTEVEV